MSTGVLEPSAVSCDISQKRQYQCNTSNSRPGWLKGEYSAARVCNPDRDERSFSSENMVTEMPPLPPGRVKMKCKMDSESLRVRIQVCSCEDSALPVTLGRADIGLF